MDDPTAPEGFDLVAPLDPARTVWSAHGPSGPVVLKWAPDAAAEAAAHASVDHPGVVRALDVVADPAGAPVLVLEHVAGGSLADLVASRGALPASQVAALGVALAEALAALHAAGLVHRDVEPSNVLLGADGSPRLADLGLATTAAEARRDPRVRGTEGFLDPRVAAGEPADRAADLYALGATLREALSGGTAAADLPGAPPSPGTPPGLTAAIAHCLAPDLGDRPRSAAALAAELRDVVADLGAGAPALATVRAGGGAHRPTRDFGPRPPRSGPPAPGLRRAAVLVPIGALVATALVLVSPLSPIRADEEGAAPPRAAPAVPTPPPCPVLDRAPGMVAADLDRDGCPSALRWDGTVLEVPEGTSVPAARYAIGRPGDELLFGDWDCDGVVTPALHRPAVGEAVVFAAWPPAGSPLEGTAGPVAVGGTAEVVTDDDGCQSLVVTPP